MQSRVLHMTYFSYFWMHDQTIKCWFLKCSKFRNEKKQGYLKFWATKWHKGVKTYSCTEQILDCCTEVQLRRYSEINFKVTHEQFEDFGLSPYLTWKLTKMAKIPIVPTLCFLKKFYCLNLHRYFSILLKPKERITLIAFYYNNR